MKEYINFFEEKLQALKNENRYRTFIGLERLPTESPYAFWHHEGKTHRIVVWCSNDYLAMSHHPAVLEAFQEAAENFGVGSGGTRNISGTACAHINLEKTMADLHQKEAALIFSSGYAANEGALSALGEALPHLAIFSDKKNHASMIQGIRHSKAEKIIFHHNDIDDLYKRLKSVDSNRPKVIAFVSVYSMDGDFAPIDEICQLARDFKALTYLDEVHAVGIYGKKGAGLAAALNLSDRIDIIQGNFAKAYGVVGGYIASSNPIVDFIRSYASSFIFTTSIPPAVAAAAQKSVEILKKDDSYRKKLHVNVAFLKQKLRLTSVKFIDSESHIVPVIVGNAQLCQILSQKLLFEHNIYVQPINYPTVPKGQERLRITVTPVHSLAHIENLVDALDKAWEELNLKRAA